MFWFVLSVPFIIVGITFMLLLGGTQATDPSRWYIIFNYKPYFHIFTFLQILFIAHVNYLEHKNNTWKNIYVLPVPRWTIFFSKAIFSYVILALNVLLFFLLVMSGGHLLGKLRPDLGFQQGNYWLETLIPTLKFFFASTGVAAIMYFISSYLKSILYSVIFGLIGYASAFALFLHNSRRDYQGFPYSEYHPFTFPGYAFGSFGTGNHSLNMEKVYYGLACGFLVLTIHYFLNSKKNIL